MQFAEFLVDALTTLKHSDPQSLQRAFFVVDDRRESCGDVVDGVSSSSSSSSSSDDQFKALTIWLEDRYIRQWTIEQRNRLRAEGSFWSVITEYLRDLECPRHYLQDWRMSPTRRVRVVHWILSCAISEFFLATNETDETTSLNIHRSSRPSCTPPLQNETNSSCSIPDASDESELLLPSKLQDFRLGFSSGDPRVDDALKVVRMQFLIALEEEQMSQNQRYVLASTAAGGESSVLLRQQKDPQQIDQQVKSHKKSTVQAQRKRRPKKNKKANTSQQQPQEPTLEKE